jgi:hypothetical protein
MMKQLSDVPVELKVPIPSEISVEFIQGMVNRMTMSFFKYGPVAESATTDAPASCRHRLDKYAETGNTEYLMDAANFAMIEFMRPAHPQAFLAPADSDESPGRITVGDDEPNALSNKDLATLARLSKGDGQ